MRFYIEHLPSRIEFRKNYSDGSGPKLKLSLTPKGEILISQHQDPGLLVEVGDVVWLVDVLRSLAEIGEEIITQLSKKENTNQ